MKKWIVVFTLGISIMFSVTACSSKNETYNVSGEEDREELQEIIKNQQKEIDELKKQTENSSDDIKNEDEIETYSDDMVIPFTDMHMQNDVRELIGVSQGDITYKMVKDIKMFEGGSDYFPYSDITPLKYFTSLRSAVVTFKGNDISAFKNLYDLEELDITADDADDLTSLSNLHNLERLSLTVDNLGDLTPLSNLHNLKELDIDGYDGICDLTPLSNLKQLKFLALDIDATNLIAINKCPNLEGLYIDNLCAGLTDLNDLQGNQSLKSISLSLFKSMDISALKTIPNLEDVLVYYQSDYVGDCSDNISDIGDIINLKKLNIALFGDNASVYDISPLKNLQNLEEVHIQMGNLYISSIDAFWDYFGSSTASGLTESEINGGNEAEEDDSSLYTVEVDAPDGYVNFRVGPGTDYEIITSISNGEVLPVVEEESDGNWLKVRFNDQYGWVASSQVFEN